MALENSVFPSRPDSLSLPVEDKGDGEEVEVATEATVSTGVFNVSQELGHVVTTETAPSPPSSAKVNKSFQAKMAEREAKANQTRKKTQGTEKERGRFGWGKWAYMWCLAPHDMQSECYKTSWLQRHHYLLLSPPRERLQSLGEFSSLLTDCLAHLD